MKMLENERKREKERESSTKNLVLTFKNPKSFTLKSRKINRKLQKSSDTVYEYIISWLFPFWHSLKKNSLGFCSFPATRNSVTNLLGHLQHSRFG